MKFDIVMITTGSRPSLLEQSLRSLRENANNWDQHALTLVMDGCSVMTTCGKADTIPNRIITSFERQGASRSRNVGASSTPKYMRNDAVMFLDDDVYCCNGWDKQLSRVFEEWTCLLSGHAHPYNHTIKAEGEGWQSTTVLSTVHFAMNWSYWDLLGFWAEPGGASASEDVDYCNRAVSKLSMPMILTKPQCIIHTGIGSTSGNKLIGWESVMENNHRLEKVYDIEGKVLYE